MFETILAFALLRVTRLSHIHFLFKWGSFHQNQHWLLIFSIILNTYDEIRILNICCPQQFRWNTFTLKKCCDLMCPSFFHPLVAFKKPTGGLPCFLANVRMVSLGAPPRYGLIGGSGVQAEGHMVRKNHISREQLTLLLMVQKSVVHQLAGSLSHYLQRSIHPRWLALGFLNHQQ